MFLGIAAAALLAGPCVSGLPDGAALWARSGIDEMALSVVCSTRSQAALSARRFLTSRMWSRGIVPRGTRLQVKSGRCVTRDTLAPESSKSR